MTGAIRHGPLGRFAERARRINALMLTCGHYDGSGDFAFRVGIPGKSGVGGGILGDRAGRGVARRLVARSQCQRQFKLGSIALEKLAKAMNWSIFSP